MQPPSGLHIPHDQLTPEALRGVIEEFVTRDGTELSEAAAKIAQVEEFLRRGEVQVWFDGESRTCNIALSPR